MTERIIDGQIEKVLMKWSYLWYVWKWIIWRYETKNKIREL